MISLADGGHSAVAGDAASLLPQAAARLPAAVRVLCPPDAPVVGTGGTHTAYDVELLRPGERAVFVSGTWLEAWRLRRLRRRLGLLVDVRYAALPDVANPLACVELDRACLRWLWQSMATVPPGRTRSALPIELVIRAGDRLRPLRFVASFAPARVVVVRRPS